MNLSHENFFRKILIIEKKFCNFLNLFLFQFLIQIGLLLILDAHLDDLYFDSDTHDRELTQAERLFMDDYAVQGVAEGVKVPGLL